MISCIQLVYSKSTPLAFWTQFFFLYFRHTSRALLDVQRDVYKMSKNSISSSQRSLTLLAFFVTFLRIVCLHVSFTAYENFYKLSRNELSCWLIFCSNSPHLTLMGKVSEKGLNSKFWMLWSCVTNGMRNSYQLVNFLSGDFMGQRKPRILQDQFYQESTHALEVLPSSSQRSPRTIHPRQSILYFASRSIL